MSSPHSASAEALKPRRRWRRGASLLLLAIHVVSTTGCTAWSRVSAPGLPNPAPQQVQAWAHDSVTILNEPTLHNDSLMGMAAVSHGEGKSTHLAMPVAGVDSIRVKTFSATRTALAAFGAAAAVGFIVAVSGGLWGDEP
jgi:hypothetical protein